LKLIELAKVGRLAALSPESRAKHAKTQRKHQAAKLAWLRSPKSSWPTEKDYIEQIQPKLLNFLRWQFLACPPRWVSQSLMPQTFVLADTDRMRDTGKRWRN